MNKPHNSNDCFEPPDHQKIGGFFVVFAARQNGKGENLRKAFVVFLLSLLLPLSANAATCSAGYWNNNGTCTECSDNHYCPGNDAMYECPAITYTDNELKQLAANDGFDISSYDDRIIWTLWAHVGKHNKSIENCLMAIRGAKVPQGRLRVLAYTYSVTTNNYTRYTPSATYWNQANAGYYLSVAIAIGLWHYIKPCTNSHPANSHYSGSGTPDSLDGTVVDANDCPWACDEGYYNNNGTCTLCEAGYYCTGGVKNNCAASYGPNGRPQYSYAGASQCTECPAATGALAERVMSYGYYPGNVPNNGIGKDDGGGCNASFVDDDPDATFETLCYYSPTDGAYGGPHSACQTYPPTECAAGKYQTMTYNEWGYQICKGVDCVKGRVCTDVGVGYYSPAGDTARYACDAKPANSHFTCSSTTNDHPWECDLPNSVVYQNACHARCPYGDGELHVGQYTHPLWADITNVTSPSVYIGELGPNHDGLCYAYLEPDDTPVDNHHGFHTVHNGVPYHAINLGLYGLE